ncbi:MAG TPA: hypothetical protein PLH11_06925 [Gemmobacter sp.]|nr:hypothetical protein [Gemmobacter sp.]
MSSGIRPNSLPRGTALPASVPLPRKLADEPAVTKDASPGQITAMVLGKTSPDGVGLLSPGQTGLPHRLWALARTEDIARRLTAERGNTLPSLQALLTTLLLAEAEPPVDSGERGVLLMARVDKLLAMGALDQAAALIRRAEPAPVALAPDLFRRRFDIALLTGTEDEACTEMQSAPHLAPTLPARIFCLARAGDWQAAALTLATSQALGQVPAGEEDLLLRFLDPAEADGAEPLPPPAQPTPLTWRMYEAIGEPLPSLGLPVAFAHAELRPQAGWKAQLEAVERLARIGAVPPQALLQLYTDRRPAASGGVWDRVAAFQRFDRALGGGTAQPVPDAVAAALPDAWSAMMAAELEAPFAQLYGARLMELPLQGEAAQLAFRIALLSPHYRAAAETRAATPAQDLQEAFLIGLARGQLQGLTAPDSMSRAIAPAFLAPQITEEAASLLKDRRVGEALLLAMDDLGRGVTGDPRGVAEGLSLLRRLGLEDAARRVALELLLLERRG